MSHDLKRAVCDNLVCIHVSCRTSSSLNHVHRELVVMLSCEDLPAGLCNSLILLVSKKTELMVCHCGTKFCESKTVDEQRMLRETETADREVFNSSKSLNSIEGLSWDLHRSYQIAFDSFHIGNKLVSNILTIFFKFRKYI